MMMPIAEPMITFQELRVTEYSDDSDIEKLVGKIDPSRAVNRLSEFLLSPLVP